MKIYALNNISKTLENSLDDTQRERLKTGRHFCVPIKNEGYLIQLNYYKMEDIEQDSERIVIFCNKENLHVFSDDAECHACANTVTNAVSPLLQLLALFFELTSDDLNDLEQMEEEISALEHSVMSDEKISENIRAQISIMRRKLLKLKKYYTQLAFIVDEIVANEIALENEVVLKEEIQHRISRFSHRLGSFLVFVQELRDSVNQLREAYQSKIDVEQNELMKFFTVISTIFLPLTVIVGWYGMNFRMPEYDWPAGYVFVVLLTLAVASITFVVFKKKRWF